MPNQFKSIPKLACIENDLFAKTDFQMHVLELQSELELQSSWCRLCCSCSSSCTSWQSWPCLSCTRCPPGHRDAQRDTVLSWSLSWPQNNSDVTHTATEFCSGTCPRVWTLHLVETHPLHIDFTVIKNLNQILLISPASPKVLYRTL